MYDTWSQGGPSGARFNRSKSGWFDITTFTDWFMKTAFPYLKKKPGKKVMIGDNLSSHLSPEVIKLCEENDIRFCFLPPNSTHLTQPLDVAFFRPLKTAWRNILTKWKKGEGRKAPSLPKDTFPKLLKQLHNSIEKNTAKNLMSGFEKCGVYPLNRDKVLSVLPKERPSPTKSTIDDSFLDVLKEMRFEDNSPKQRRRKVSVAPGKSVSGHMLHAENPETDGEDMPVEPAVVKPIDDESVSSTESDTSTESDSSEPINLQKNDFVIFSYEEELFPGQIKRVLKNDEVEIKSMVKSGRNWKWPKKEDCIVYPRSDIKQKISQPAHTKRGVFHVKELQYLWG